MNEKKKVDTRARNRENAVRNVSVPKSILSELKQLSHFPRSCHMIA